MKRRAQGFSLIELLVVIGIILILMGLLMAALWRARLQEKIMHATNEVRNLKAAAEAYQQDFGTYPPDTAAFGTGDIADTVIDSESIYKYLSLRRKDPKTGTQGGPYYVGFDTKRLKGPTGKTYCDIWGRPYQFDAVHQEINAATGDVTRRGEPYPAGGDASQKVASVKVWSFGPDGKDATGSNQFEGKGTLPDDLDNIGSWTE